LAKTQSVPYQKVIISPITKNFHLGSFSAK